MADTNEEQLLNELLRAIGKADREMQAPGIDALEARVLACWDSAASRRRERSWKAASVVAGVAAALVIALAGFWLSREVPAPVVATHPAPAPSQAEAAVAAAPPQSAPALSPARRSITQSPIAQSPITQAPPITQSQMSAPFMPLRPLSEHELSGPFQVVRVQVSLASLGGLTSPLQHPGELVDADLLLGEDGVARAIRIAVDESHYPWRSR